MVNWQITAKTIYCESVHDEVTLMVYKDGSAKCSGYHKYNQPSPVTARLIRSKSRLKRQPVKCDLTTCNRLGEYKDKVFQEENGTDRPAGK